MSGSKRLSPLRAAFVEALLFGTVFGGLGYAEVKHGIESGAEARHVALVAALAGGLTTYRERKNALKPGP